MHAWCTRGAQQCATHAPCTCTSTRAAHAAHPRRCPSPQCLALPSPPSPLQAFEGFRRSYRKNEAIEASKQELKTKYDAAKRLGEHVNGARSRINAAKAQLESVRHARAATP